MKDKAKTEKSLDKEKTLDKEKPLDKEKSKEEVKTPAKKETKKTSKKEVKAKKIHKPYLGYGMRVYMSIVLFTVFLIASAVFATSSFTHKSQEIVDFKEQSNLDYTVNLKNNSFYDNKTLGKDMLYVASLIDSIDANFNYNFNIEKNIPMNFKYNVVAKLVVADEASEHKYLEKEYVLVEDKEVSLNDNTSIIINEKVNIDYGYYNRIASSFKTTYGIDSKSNLIVTMRVVKNSADDNFRVSGEASDQVINIPLSERSVDINLNYVDINKASYATGKSGYVINNMIYVIISLVMLILSITFMAEFFHLVRLIKPSKTKFDKYINKLLREYDRLIVESYTAVNFDNYEVIKVKRFEELLDVRDNLKLPINYYVVTPHQKAYFYVVGKTVYLLTVKAIDFDEKEKS